ncbi:MAG: GMC family oxidoreductase N-terminal domain-containing protein [Nevskiales bacterium]
MAIDDIYTKGIASGWKVRDASSFAGNQQLEADVVIVGSGAGGGTTAEILSAAGLKVLMLEEGPLKTAADFKHMDEARAYAELYQEGGGRATSDGAIGILQGRSVGGTTTVNYTSSFRTPPETLKHWAEVHEVKGHGVEEMAPWFEKSEQRLGIMPWGMPPNPNNSVLQRGAEKLGWEWHVIPRNVRGCWNTGYCGLGCPVNAKQSMLVTTIPAALGTGAELIHHLRVQRVNFDQGRVTSLSCEALDPVVCLKPTGARVEVRATHYILAGGAINTPALLLRSQAPDPHQRVGQRTTIHPVNFTLGLMPERIDPYYGAPQSIASDQFQWQDGATGPMGYKLEVPPLFPTISASIFGSFGEALRQDMASFPHTNALLALLRDGFVEESPGGRVRIDASGMPLLNYDLSDYAWDGAKRAYLSMAEAQFAAGATKVRAAHLDSPYYNTWAEAKAAIPELAYKKFKVGLFTAHLMGGCAMSQNEKKGVVNSRGRHHQVENLSVFDGSLFPTSIGANPQLSIYGLVTQLATSLSAELKSV